MDFQFNDEQKALQSSLRKFCESRIHEKALLALEDSCGISHELWQELVSMGVLSSHLGPDQGGWDASVVEGCLCFQELGRSATPGPLIWNYLAAQYIDGIAQGKKLVTGLDLFRADIPPYRLEHLNASQVLILLREEGIYSVNPAELSTHQEQSPLDPLTPITHCHELPQGSQLANAEQAKQMWLKGAILTSAYLLGMAEKCLEMANEYAKQRQQFDKSIGQFQSIKHLLADMFVKQEVARSACYAAACVFEDPTIGNITTAIGSARINASDAALFNAKTCIQIYGGMGYTWEIPIHYYLKRCWVLADLFGNSDYHADTIANTISEELE